MLLLSAAGSLAQRRGEYIAKIKQTPPLLIPEEAKKSGLGGPMYVWVDLDADGNVVSVDSVAGPAPVCRNVTRPDVVALRAAATEAAKLATFAPMIEDGKRQIASGVVQFDVPAGSAAGDDQIVDMGSLSAAGSDGSDSFLKRTAIKIPKPVFPPAAKAVRASGPVSVKVLIDETGSVFSAQAVRGHPLLRAAAAQTACRATFRPTVIGGKPVKITGIIIYNFIP